MYDMISIICWGKLELQTRKTDAKPSVNTRSLNLILVMIVISNRTKRRFPLYEHGNVCKYLKTRNTGYVVIPYGVAMCLVHASHLPDRRGKPC
jgi:hypothetical protein